MRPLRHARLLYEGPKALRPPRGVLLHGPPGTGKTMLATAAAGESGASLVRLHAAALESKWYGDTPRLLAKAFEAARRRAPSVILFDELDALGRARTDGEQAPTYTLKCELLRQLDGLGDAAVVVVACTNCAHLLDPALRRRFGRALEVPAPATAAERRAVLAALVRTEGVTRPTPCSRRSRRADGWSGSDLSALHRAASAVRVRVEDEAALRAAPDGEALLASLGPLRPAHYEAAAVAVGRRLGPPRPAEAEAEKRGSKCAEG